MDVAGLSPVARVEPRGVESPQGYRLTLTPRGVEIVGHDPAGVFYGQQTWAQLVRSASPRWGGDGRLPCLVIQDRPDFVCRGVMLDVSRDRVPTLDTLEALVDRLAHFKINQLQLYTEHTFAYAGHEAVWRDASPFTPDDIKRLDAYCAKRFIELVPNQNCFGHMERWLKHPAYRHLSERPAFVEGDDAPAFYRHRVERGTMGHVPGVGSTLCPVEPESLGLVDDLLAQCLPCFGSARVNVGGDETFDLGAGRSRNACETKGKGRVYLDYLKQLHAAAARRGSAIQFWGDLAEHHPDLLAHAAAELPGATTLLWGYEKHQTFEDSARRCAQADLPFFVCPSTSTFNSFTGRYDTMAVNQRHAAESGLRYGAAGYLNTVWGDWGHWHTQAVNDPGLVLGAALSWCTDANRELDLCAALSQHVYDDPTGHTAGAVRELGGVEQDTAAIQTTNSLNWALVLPDAPLVDGRLDRGWDCVGPFTAPMLDAVVARTDRAVGLLERARPEATDAALVLEELGLAAGFVRHAAQNLRARLDQNAPHPRDLDAATRQRLDDELTDLTARFARAWRTRSREGGLADSVGPFERLRQAYRRR